MASKRELAYELVSLTNNREAVIHGLHGAIVFSAPDSAMRTLLRTRVTVERLMSIWDQINAVLVNNWSNDDVPESMLEAAVTFFRSPEGRAFMEVNNKTGLVVKTMLEQLAPQIQIWLQTPTDAE